MRDLLNTSIIQKTNIVHFLLPPLALPIVIVPSQNDFGSARQTPIYLHLTFKESESDNLETIMEITKFGYIP